jgi:hypothetical protein
VGFHETLFNFGFVAWLDAPLLQYMIASYMQYAVLVLVLMGYVNTTQLWLCGWVGCSVTMVHEV